MQRPSGPLEHRVWLDNILSDHARLATTVHSLLENLLQKKKIEFLNVTSRVKGIESALEKIVRKGYDRPQLQLTDLTGIRIITFLEEQVSQISELISQLFDIDKENSLDRTSVLGHDRIGYRSTHFVCSLGKQRNVLPEYEALGQLKFEIQIRTVLQHAWAELAHDRSFKFGSALPTKIQRRLNLYSGLLELVDSSFDQLSKEIDEYKRSLVHKNVEEISDLEINSITVSKLVSDIAKSNSITFIDDDIQNFILDEFKSFGIATIGQLERMFTSEYLQAYKKYADRPTATGFARNILFYDDLAKQLSNIKITWMAPQVVDILASKYGKEILEKELADRNIAVSDSPPSRQRSGQKVEKKKSRAPRKDKPR